MQHINLIIADSLFNLVKLLSVVEEYFKEPFYLTKNIEGLSSLETAQLNNFVKRLLDAGKIQGVINLDDLMRISYNNILLSSTFGKELASKLLITRYNKISFIENDYKDYVSLSESEKKLNNRSHYDYEVLFNDSTLYLSKPDLFTKPKCYSELKPIHLSKSIMEILRRDFLKYEEVFNLSKDTPVVFLDTFFDDHVVYEYIPAVYHYLEDTYEKQTLLIKYSDENNKKVIPRNVDIVDCDYKMPNELLNYFFTGRKYIFSINNVLLFANDFATVQLLKVRSDSEEYNEKIDTLLENNFNGLQIKEI